MGNSWRFPASVALRGDKPPVARTVGALLDEIASRIPDAEAVVGGETRLTYRRLRERVDAVARGMLALGVGKGDHVAIFMGNRPEWLVTWYALNKIGAVAVGVSTWSSPPELAYVLRHADASVLVAADRIGERDLGAIVRAALPGLAGEADGSRLLLAEMPHLRAVVAVGDPSPGMRSLDDVIAAGEQVPAELLAAAQSEVKPHEVALLPYTSGSSGTPKGVQLVHRGMIENGYNIGEAEQFREGDRFWLLLPLFWSAGNANTTMVALTHGGTLVLQEVFDAEETVRLFEQERCTHYFAFPNVTAALHHAAAGRMPLRAARVAVSTGNPETLRMLRELGFSVLLHPYGTTEDYGFATINAPEDPIEVLTTTQGRPLPGMELKITDVPTGRTLGPGEEGEICLRGYVTPGYWKDEDKNVEAFDDEGFFHTGDYGLIDADGRLRLGGRIRELIKTSGFNVAPAEVEAVVQQHPGVAEAYVVGVPDEVKGQIVAAFVRPTSAGVDAGELRAFCRERLSSYKVPALIELRDGFPLTTTGKVSKRLLLESVRSQPQPSQ